MNRNEFKRVKHGQTPGDIPKRFKISMREKKEPFTLFNNEYTEKSIKAFNKVLNKKSKKVQRQRNKKEINQE